MKILDKLQTQVSRWCFIPDGEVSGPDSAERAPALVEEGALGLVGLPPPHALLPVVVLRDPVLAHPGVQGDRLAVAHALVGRVVNDTPSARGGRLVVGDLSLGLGRGNGREAQKSDVKLHL